MGQWDNTYPIPFEDELDDAYDGKIKGVSISWEEMNIRIARKNLGI